MMIQIHKVNDIETVKTLAKNNNIEYTLCHNAVAVFDGDKILEYLIYCQNENVIDIEYISNQNNDFQLILGVLKTLLFLADLSMVSHVTMPLEYKRQAISIGFEENVSNYQLKLEDYQNKCGC